MKKTFIYLLILLAFACRKQTEYTLSGTLHTDGNTVVETLGIQTPDTLFTITADSSGHFSVAVPSPKAAFCHLFGVASTGGERRQFSTPVALHPDTPTHLDFHLTDSQIRISATDPDNRTLQAFREWSLAKSRTLWSNPPAETDIASHLALFPSEAQHIILREHPGKATADYLATWANIECLNLANGLFYGKMPASIASHLPSVPKTLDVPYWTLFYSSELYIIEHLQQSAPEPEAQLALLQKEFRTPSLREKVTRRIIENYVRQRSFSEEHLARLDKLCHDQPDKEQLLQQFRDKRYASPGAPLPDVVFEDREGKEHRLSEFAGKYIYIDLWASWCGPCVAEVPHLQKLEKELRRRDVAFVSISLDTKRANWEQKMDQLHMHGNQWIVRDETFANMMNIKGIPHFLLYGKDGKLMVYKAPRPSHPAWQEELRTL